MQVSEVMTRGVKCISPNATVQEAARQMSECDVGAFPSARTIDWSGYYRSRPGHTGGVGRVRRIADLCP